MAKQRTAGVFVLGMHRSGTSAAVLSLESLGLKLCSEEDRLRKGMGNSNPDHGESITVIAENDALLDLAGGSWMHPRTGPGWLTGHRAQQRLSDAKAAFERAHPSGPWACKDPRLCLTLPFWEQALPGIHPIVIVLRHPLEIVQSLQAREGTTGAHHSASYYLALWERYTRSALINAARHPVYIVGYSDLVSNWDHTAAQLAKWLRRHGVPAAHPESSPVDPGLRHYRAPSSLTGLTPDQRRLHKLATGLTGPHHRLRLPNLGRETPRTTALFGPGPEPAEAGFLALPAVKSVQQRLAQINPLASKHYIYLGLAATALLAAASVTLMRLSQLDNPTAVDKWLTQHLIQPHWPAFDGLLKFVSATTTRSYLDVAAVIAVGTLLLWRKYSAAATLSLGLLVSELIASLLRGQSHDPAGFFGGHSFRTAVLLGLIGYFAFRLIKNRLLARAAATACVSVVVLVAVSRTYMQSHYPSAILASLILGAAVSVLLIAVFESIQKSPHRLPPQRRAAASKAGSQYAA